MKKFTKILACVLAILMCMSVVILPTFAEEEKKDEIDYAVNADFEDYKAGGTIAADDYFTRVCPINKVLTDEDGNKFVRIPYAGRCNVTSGSGDIGGNADTAFYPKHKKLSYTDSKYMLFEASYRWEPQDVQPRVELQFQQIQGYKETTDKDGNKTLATTATNGSWISFLRIDCATNTLTGLQNTTGIGKLDNTQWNRIRVIFDLERGTYDVYVNGQLYAYENYFTGAATGQDEGWRNVSIEANRLIIMKCNKAINVYNENTGKAPYDVYVDLDDIKMWQLTEDDLCEVKLNGTAMKFLKDQEVSLKKAGYTFRYADVKNLDDDTTTRIFTPSFVASASKGMEVDATYVTGTFFGYEDWEFVGNPLTDKDVAGDIPDSSKYELVKIPYVDEDGNNQTNTQLKIFFTKEGCEKKDQGTGGTSYVDKNMAIKNEGITYDINDLTMNSAHIVRIRADYFFSEGAKGQIQGQLKSFKTGDKTTSWGGLFYLAAIDGTSIAVRTDSGTRTAAAMMETETVKDASGNVLGTGNPLLKNGMNFTIEVVLNLVTGYYDVYAITTQEVADPEDPEQTITETVRTLMIENAILKGNGVAHATNITILPNTLLMAKLNKLNNTGHVNYEKDADGNNDFVAGSYYTVDNIQLEEGEKVQIWYDVKFDGDTTFANAGQITWWVGDSYSVELEGYDVSLAQIKLPLPAGAPEGTENERLPIADPANIIIGTGWETIEVTYTNYISTEDFEKYDQGKTLTKEDGYASTPLYNIIEVDANEEGEPIGKYLHIPFQGMCKAGKWTADGSNYNGNADTSLTLNHREISKDVVLEMRYRPHFVDLAADKVGYEYSGEKQNPTVEVQFAKVKHDAVGDAGTTETTYISLFKIDLATGALIDTVGTVIEGAEGLKNDEWNTVKVMIDVANGTYNTYVNGKLYATDGYISKDNKDSGLKNIVILENSLIVAKLNKNVGAYKQIEGTATDRSEDLSYIDVDDAVFRYKKLVNVTLNGLKASYKEGTKVDLTQEGSIFLFATIDGKLTYDTVFEPVEGMEIVANYISDSFTTYSEASLRKGNPSGIRFVTYVNITEISNLRKDTNIKDFHYGTLIAPKSYVDAAGAFTKEALDKLTKVGDTDITGAKYLSVDAASKGYYDGIPDVAGTMSYAGSLANIKAEHYDWEFTAIGFIEFTLGEKTLTFYASYETTEATEEAPAKVMAPVASLSALAKDALENDAMLNEAVKEMLRGFLTDEQ